ncbi:MAG: hypothetical protein IKQ35_01565 [Bacilli bacterium]|nr:hypothetical protein [Bacilli bacterium]
MDRERIIGDLKRKAILSYSKFLLSNEKEANDDVLIKSIILSWLDGEEDFDNRFLKFQELDRLITDSGLFEMVESINTSGDFTQVDQAINTYRCLTENEEYKLLIRESGYALPNSFSERENYTNGSLNSKVHFYRTFKSQLTELNEQLKGVHDSWKK